MLTGEILRTSAKRQPGKTALIDADGSISYGELDARANQIANALIRQGIGPGDHVVLICPNGIEYVAIHFGAARAGCILIHVSPLFGPVELGHIIDQTKPRLAFVHGSLIDQLTAITPALKEVPTISIGDAIEAPGARSLSAFVTASNDLPPEVQLSEDDPFAMTFTGGTTGLPKGAIVNHRSRFVSAYSTAIEHQMTREDVVAVVTPLYHVVSLLVWMQAAFLLGCTCVLQRKWDVAEFARLVKANRVSSVFMVPVQLRALLTAMGDLGDGYPTLRQIGCGGAILATDVKRECLERLPHVTLVDHYGQSETGLLTVLNTNRHRDKLDTNGLPAVGVELEIRSPDGKPLPPGEIGAITVRGDYVFLGYLDNPEENRLYFKDDSGWAWTGDLGVMDADGFLTIVGRAKEMIVSGGINIYPREVERVLEAREDIVDCAVFGIPDEQWGEALVACVVAAEGIDLSESDLIRFCESRLARYKRPKHVWLLEKIAKTPSGKTMKSQLRSSFIEYRRSLDEA